MTSAALPSRALNPWVIWSCGAFFYMYQFVLRVSPSVMTDHLMRDFAVGSCALGVLTAFYYKAYSALQIPLGLILDRFGPRRILTFSCLLCVVGTVLFATSTHLEIASLGRFMMGAGSACAFIGTIKLISLWFRPSQVAPVIGYTMLLGTVGASCGGMPLALLLDGVGWRQALLLVAGGGVALATLIWALVRDHNPERPLDPEFHSRTSSWDNFISIISSYKIWAVALFGSLMYVPLSAFADLWGPHFIGDLYDLDRKTSASVVTMIFFGVALGAPLATHMAEYYGNRRQLMAVSALFCLILYSMMLYVPIPLWAMYILLFMAGAAFGAQLLCFSIVCELVPLSMSGLAVGFTNMIVMLSGVIFEPLVGWLLEQMWDGQTVDGSPLYLLTDWKIALLPVPLSLLGALLLIKVTPETFSQKRHGIEIKG